MRNAEPMESGSLDSAIWPIPAMKHLFPAVLVIVGGALVLAPLVAFHMSRAAHQAQITTILAHSANQQEFNLKLSSFRSNGGNEPHIYDAWAGFYWIGGGFLIVLGIVFFLHNVTARNSYDSV